MKPDSVECDYTKLSSTCLWLVRETSVMSDDVMPIHQLPNLFTGSFATPLEYKI